MPETEKAAKADAEEKTTSGRQSPLTLNVPGQQTAPKGTPSGNTQGRSSRQTSPTRLSTELTLKHSKLNDVEKLHYLRGCVQGIAEQLIRGLPLTGDSLQPSWDLLTSRFENKRLIIQAHFDSLFNLTPASPKNAASLIQLVTTVSEVDRALKSLGIAKHMWDCLLVHHVSRFLDRNTRVAWETSLGSSHEYPRFTQLEAFLNARARALEKVEATPSPSGHSLEVTPSSSKSAIKRVTAHKVSAPATSQTTPQG
ncbi:PREDICTED: uncharacterized protein LOC105571000 [Vollenhovia emeryi]|uniref:uncharacterized protein LOC105571000 n=1 Tax=Vollenhovia emeryi TaxID=411798 RepID=UPI0005F589CA|nr:PREDICTED: uncharacterized protein LOC105571000 [Vollenhovia emeryi]